MKKTYLLLCSGLLISSVANAACYNKTCTELGYTQSLSECDKFFDIIRCPFDTSKVFCETKELKCAPGDIYYSDGTCDVNVIAGKAVVGLVIDVTDGGQHGKLISLDETSAKWSTPGNSNLSCLPDLDNAGAAVDLNGKNNTSCIMSEQNSGNTYPAAEYCNGYKPVSSGIGSTGWYLPALGELKMISFYFSRLNISLQYLSKIQLSSGYYWSSSEYDDPSHPGGYAWVVYAPDGNLSSSLKSYYVNKVRCVLEF